MKRSAAREIAVQLCYSFFNNSLPIEELLDSFFDREYYATLAEEEELYSEYPDSKQEKFIRLLVSLVTDNFVDIDKTIETFSRNWKTDRFSGIVLNILRCAISEIQYMEEIPVSVSINEAVELAKKYDSDEAASFINGILGSFVKDINTDTE